jgi:hypothetical protein
VFGSPKPVVLESYGHRRRRKPVPRWLVWSLVGIAVGASAVVFVQERYLPPRLSAAESSKLRTAFDDAERERVRLQGELDQRSQSLEAALAGKKALEDDLATARQSVDRLRGDFAAVVESFPPDPRGGVVEVRAAKFSREGASLAYDVVLSRSRGGSKAQNGVMQLVVSGVNGSGTPTSVPLKPVAISVTDYQSLRGSLPLPEGFNPRQTTIHVRDRVDGRLLGLRVLYVK